MISSLPADAREALDQVIHRVTGRAVDSLKVMGSRADYFVVQAAAGSTRLVVKLAGPLSSEPVSAAASAAHRLANRVTKMPMSRLLAVDDSMSSVPYRYTV
jgi:hypothetical protein